MTNETGKQESGTRSGGLIDPVVNCPTAEQLVKIAKGHKFRKCPECGLDCSATAMVKLVYTFEPCGCAAASFTHLVETLYHRECFLKANTDLGG